MWNFYFLESIIFHTIKGVAGWEIGHNEARVYSYKIIMHCRASLSCNLLHTPVAKV